MLGGSCLEIGCQEMRRIVVGVGGMMREWERARVRHGKSHSSPCFFGE